jgi:hypothetical protein
MRRDGSFEAEANSGEKHAFEMAKDGKARWLKEPSSAAAHEHAKKQDVRCVEKCAGGAGGSPRPIARKNSLGAACQVPRAAVTEDGHQGHASGVELQPCAERIVLVISAWKCRNPLLMAFISLSLSSGSSMRE